MDPKPGELVLLDARASVQFAGTRALVVRVIKVEERPPYDRWGWMTGYVLDDVGNATDRRELYVQFKGLTRVNSPLQTVARRQRVPESPAKRNRPARKATTGS
ncbi:hypothetical protein [Micromonospora sp. NBRC 101691]|uniref:hypothetical protein n=1 Tax=Micromonospora sp. NBRC 101691 TaxID=3032198 RepID=UPI0024A60121|nr:hypothetical protein [Micromonospora sp. NBRC 101691]GLY23709.1 hypothetical protein Misp04_34410 [Micromonospora sp. NBRC 101691]